MKVCPKYEIACGFEKQTKHSLVLAADATRKVVKKTIGDNVFVFKARGYFRTFGPTYDLEIFRLADPGCISFFKNV